MSPMVGALVLLARATSAYETDQLTDRDRPLDDAGPAADAMMNDLLDQALRRANDRAGCSADDDRMKRALGRAIYDVAATNTRVRRRGPVRGLGFGRLAAQLEEDPAIDRRTFDDRSDIYGELTLWHSTILTVAGPCSTIRLHGIDVGTDKVDHFVEVGWVYLRVSRWGAHPERALRHGTRTERGAFGLWTSKAFSFGDLAANHAGFRFYEGLLEPGSTLRRGASGCVERVAPFTFEPYVDRTWDEVASPNVYTRLVQRGLDRTLDEREAELCAGYAAWGAGYPEALAEVLSAPSPDVWGRVPERTDPFRLEARCEAAPLNP